MLNGTAAVRLIYTLKFLLMNVITKRRSSICAIFSLKKRKNKLNFFFDMEDMQPN